MLDTSSETASNCLSLYVSTQMVGTDFFVHLVFLAKITFFGEDYIERIAEDVMRKRAEVLDIPFKSSIETTEPGCFDSNLFEDNVDAAPSNAPRM
jgi:hypothetical protein